MTQPPVVTAIRTEVQSPQVQAAMLMGSSFEGGWGPAYGVGDDGTSFGPYQMHEGGALTATGLTPAQAEDPTTATRAMEPYYENGVNQVPVSLWQSNPAMAAEEAAVAAESPAQSYLSSYGQSAVDQHWSTVEAALNGENVTSSSDGGTPATLTGSTSPIPGLPSWLGDALNWAGVGIPSDITDYAERLGLIVFGAVLIFIGLFVLARVPQQVASIVGDTAVTPAKNAAKSQVSSSVTSGTKKALRAAFK